MRLAGRGCEVTCVDPQPTGVVDPASGDFQAIADTTAWNWQMGCMLQWCDWAPEPTVLFNTRHNAGFGAALHNLDGRLSGSLPLPVFGEELLLLF